MSIFNNDKDLAIIALTVLGVVAMICIGDSKDIILTIVGALGGFTAGQVYK
jgi:hypothetical protein